MNTFTPEAFRQLTTRLRASVERGTPIHENDLELLLEWCALITFPRMDGATLPPALPSHLNQSPTSSPS